MWVRSAPFFEPDPLERVSGPSSAGNLPKIKYKLQFLSPILSEGKIFILALGTARLWRLGREISKTAYIIDCEGCSLAGPRPPSATVSAKTLGGNGDHPMLRWYVRFLFCELQYYNPNFCCSYGTCGLPSTSITFGRDLYTYLISQVP